MHLIDAQTKLCAVIGNPVGHSLSPAIHNAAYQAMGANCVYVAFEVSDVENCLNGMRALPSFLGMSVTIPHKQTVMPYLDRIDPMAEKVGSVNTIYNDKGVLVGSTTDGPGTLCAFSEGGVDLSGKCVLFLGTGGAARAVAFAMAEHSGARHIHILGRTLAKVNDLVGDISSKTPASVSGGSLADDLEDAAAHADVIINGTPIGMAPHDTRSTPLPSRFLKSTHIVFDMVYRPLKTRLLRDAAEKGCITLHGTEMLLHQATLQIETWTKMKAPLEIMRRALFDALDVNSSRCITTANAKGE